MSFDFLVGLYLGGVIHGLFYIAFEWEDEETENKLSRIWLSLLWPTVIVMVFIGRLYYKHKAN